MPAPKNITHSHQVSFIRALNRFMLYPEDVELRSKIVDDNLGVVALRIQDEASSLPTNDICSTAVRVVQTALATIR